MATKEEKLKDMYKPGLKDSVMSIVQVLLLLFGLYYSLEIKHDFRSGIIYSSLFIGITIVWIEKICKVIEKLNTRISDLEELLAQKHS